ncbi:hypothetical protein AAFF_G00223790 [Aldrovandia affinis]|uniref:Uncharacterized protein n=1 Tax=Aldrovandia affinis TaxID=143900 RepID=A0AAD7X1D2_9TELE|nr:hypothetical protein AAFF_G00223790 [Aldrovandia affinis]
MNRRLITALDRLHPDYVSDMHHKQEPQLPQSLEIMVTCQGYLRNHHWNRPHRQGQERQKMPITPWLRGVLVDPCVCLSLPLTYDVRQENVTHHGI